MSFAALAQIADADLEALARWIRRDRPPWPPGRLDLSHGNLEHASEAILRALGPLPIEAALAVAEAVLAERRRLHGDPELVWSGPDLPGPPFRQTSVVVQQLFREARSEVWIVGYAFDHGAEIFEVLHESMRGRGVEVRILLDLGPDVGLQPEAEAVDAAVARFVGANWPFGEPRPRFHYDRRPWHGPTRASVHAKCVVTDATHVLITSANFTARGQQRNLEIGVLFDRPALARQIVGRLQAALASRHLG